MRASELLTPLSAARAEAVLRKAIQVDRQAPEPRLRLSDLLMESDRIPEAIDLMEAAAGDIAGGRASEILLRASHAAEHLLGDRTRALRLARLAAQAAPSSGPVALRLADLSYLAGARDEAALALTRALDASSPDDQPESWITWCLRLFEMRASQDRPEAALRWLERAAELAPWRVDVAQALFEALRPTDPRAAVERLCQVAESLRPGVGSHGMLVMAGTELQRSGDLPRASHLFRAALVSAPDASHLEERLIDLYLQQNDLTSATELLQQQGRRALESGDLDAALLALRDAAELLERGGRLEEASQMMDQLASVLIRAGRTAEAARTLMRRGELFRDALKDPAVAEVELRRALDLDPSNIDPLRLLQSMYQARGDSEGEVEALRAEAARLEEGRRLSRVLLRVAELTAGPLNRPAEAEAALVRVLSLEPTLEPARALWEQLLRSEGRWMELARAFGGAPRTRASRPAACSSSGRRPSCTSRAGS